MKNTWVRKRVGEYIVVNELKLREDQLIETQRVKDYYVVTFLDNCFILVNDIKENHLMGDYIRAIRVCRQRGKRATIKDINYWPKVKLACIKKNLDEVFCLDGWNSGCMLYEDEVFVANTSCSGFIISKHTLESILKKKD